MDAVATDVAALLVNGFIGLVGLGMYLAALFGHLP